MARGSEGSSQERAATVLFAGAVAGGFAKTLIAPLDRTKIIFQTSSGRPFSWHAVDRELRRIVQEEGVAALWRGNSATLSRVMPYAAIQFGSFDVIKRELMVKQGRKLNWWENLATGAAAGAISVCATYPLDLMRARMAVLSPASGHVGGIWDNLKIAYADGGANSLYRGLAPTLLGILPYAGISFATFEGLKAKVAQYKGRSVNTAERLGCGAIAGLVAQSVTYPLDIIRRRMQTEGFVSRKSPREGDADAKKRRYVGVVQSLKLIYKEEGPQALFKALGMNFVKGPIAVGVSFATHDFIVRTFGHE